MAYTNGFDLTKVMDALVGRIGWRVQDGITPTAPNDGSKSGRYFQDFHSSVNLKSLKQTQSDRGMDDAAFNLWLKSLQEGVILRCLNGVFKKPELLDNTLLFDRLVYNDQPISNSGNFVGVRFKIPAENISLRINAISLLFTEAKTFKLYLFHDTKALPLWSQDVTTVANDQKTIKPVVVIDQVDPTPDIILDLVINTRWSDVKGGYYYLGYFQDDLGTCQAIWEQPHFLPAYCFGYGFIQTKKTGVEVFDKRTVSVTNQTYGLNMDVTSFRDHTNSILRNAHLFDEVLGLQMASQCVEHYIHSGRSNGEQRVNAEQGKMLYTDLNQEQPSQEIPFTTGLKGQIRRELKQISDTFFPVRKSQIANHAGC